MLKGQSITNFKNPYVEPKQTKFKKGRNERKQTNMTMLHETMYYVSNIAKIGTLLQSKISASPIEQLYLISRKIES